MQMLTEEILSALCVKQDRRIAGLTPISTVILSAVVSYSTMTTTGLLRGATIEMESAVPEMDGQRVRVVLETVEEQRLSAQQQREFWRVWVELGPEGPIEDGVDTDFP
jgi:hypothetical protein